LVVWGLGVRVRVLGFTEHLHVVPPVTVDCEFANVLVAGFRVRVRV